MLTMYFPVVSPMRNRETRACEGFCVTETNYSRNCDCGCDCSGGCCGCNGSVNRRRSYRRNRTNFTTILVTVSLILATQTCMTAANIMGEECDWFGR
jgi:hypothetical protein